MNSLKLDSALIKSSTKTLFQTEAWQEAWLATWGDYAMKHGRSPTNFSAGTYRVTQHIKKILPVTTTVPLGNPATGIESIRREYGQWAPVQIQQFVNDTKSQLLLSDVIIGSETDLAITRCAADNDLLMVRKNSNRAYSVNVSAGDYAAYLQSRGSNTRLKLYDRRKRLAECGDIEFINLWPDLDQFIDKLNVFHRARWHKSSYSQLNRRFLEQLMQGLHRDGHGVDLSVMRVNGQDVSLLHDIEVNGTVHNLQAGYIEDFVKGVSLGTLHLGYQLEQAFSQGHIERYDFMAGEGKNFDYKAALATQYCEIADFYLIKPTWLKALYQLHERQGIRSFEGATS